MLEINSRLFTWDPETDTFSAEASTLEAELERQGWRRLDFRGGQWGFHMLSHRTGRHLWFQRHREHHNDDGELTHVEFHAHLSPHRMLRLLVFND